MSDYITIELSKNKKFTGKNRDTHTGKYFAIVDSVDADLDQYNWSIVNKKYAGRSSDKKYLHRIILARKLERDELLPTEHVDHIDGDGLNNRRDNLRLATRNQNMHNARISKRNKSGYKGVDLHKATQRWRATIMVNRKCIHLGLYNTAEEAYEAYCKAAKELHGEFANFG